MMLSLKVNVPKRIVHIVRAFSDTQQIYDRSNSCLYSSHPLASVISHRNVLAKRKDMKDYSYLRNDIIEQITDRLLVIIPMFSHI